MVFAVIQTGGKQYKVSPEQKIKIEKVEGDKDAVFVFDKVLLVADADKIKIGAPYVDGAKAEGIILKQARDRKKSFSSITQKLAIARKKATASILPK